MTKQNKLSRREAIKILGTATGASLLANIPAKWSRPEVTGSPLPAFAQTSCIGVTLTLAAVENPDGDSISVVSIPGFGIDWTDPNEVVWDGNVGSYRRWYCQDFCLGFRVSLTGGTTNFASVKIDTLSLSSPLILNLVDGGASSFNVLIDMQTGDYDSSADFNLTLSAGICVYGV